MSYINKPKVAHPTLPTNALGLTRRQYEGVMSTLCAGCGHDSVTAAIVEACWGIDLRPEQLAKLSGIGCSSKTTAYFVSGAHGFNSVHGRMPSWDSWRTRSAATSTCCISSRTMACMA
jgi:2-oxoglutarate ferredoxin oxidoreductase subunit beta